MIKKEIKTFDHIQDTNSKLKEFLEARDKTITKLKAIKKDMDEDSNQSSVADTAGSVAFVGTAANFVW